jgi:activator of 2-hydroxyglutaryl-CoA dehydratase
MLTVGIDIGSISAKAAVIRDGQLVGSKVMLTGYNANRRRKGLCGPAG